MKVPWKLKVHCAENNALFLYSKSYQKKKKKKDDETRVKSSTIPSLRRSISISTTPRIKEKRGNIPESDQNPAGATAWVTAKSVRLSTLRIAKNIRPARRRVQKKKKDRKGKGRRRRESRVRRRRLLRPRDTHGLIQLQARCNGIKQQAAINFKATGDKGLPVGGRGGLRNSVTYTARLEIFSVNFQ